MTLFQDVPRASAAFAMFPPEPTPAQEPGCSPTLSVLLRSRGSNPPAGGDRRRGRSRTNNGPPSEFFFDPLGLATVQNFARYREAELKAGRVAMLALLQTMAVPLAQAVAPAAPSASSWLPWEPMLKMNGGILTNEVESQDLAMVIGTCFVLESVLTMPESDSMPGDYGWGWFGRRDKGEHERELICELEHGRLAMVAFAVQLILEQKTGLPWEQQWIKLLQDGGMVASHDQLAVAPDVSL